MINIRINVSELTHVEKVGFLQSIINKTGAIEYDIKYDSPCFALYKTKELPRLCIIGSNLRHLNSIDHLPFTNLYDKILHLLEKGVRNKTFYDLHNKT